jgi:type IV secretory pathway VirB6-like protein
MSQTDNLEERFRELEREVMGNKQANSQQPSQPHNPDKRAEPEFVAVSQGVDAAKTSLASLIDWVNSLTGATKVAAIVVIGLVAFTLLNFVFKLVTAAISIGILALVGFILYKVFFEPTENNFRIDGLKYRLSQESIV